MDSAHSSSGHLFDMANEALSYIDSIHAKLRLLNCEITTLTRLRDRMSGNLRIACQRNLRDALALRDALNKELRAYRGEA